jgi:hypothetical protein
MNERETIPFFYESNLLREFIRAQAKNPIYLEVP